MMFTGIVSELGFVRHIERIDGGMHLRVEAPETVSGVGVGDSVALNGVCLTVVDFEDRTFSVQIVDESLGRSSFGAIVEGDAVNLERPLPASGRFDGHIVQGHVDGIGRITSIVPEGEAARYRISFPSALDVYVVEKGSIAVDGVSLTVTAVSEVGEENPWFEIVLIPHTLDVTIFGQRGVGAAVNLEVDVIAKYLERMVGTPR
ncbi:MAG: riboflavin synthase [Acidimicrobiia bacterium]